MKRLGIVACAIVCAGLFAQTVVQAGVWRVRQNYSNGGKVAPEEHYSLYTNMPDYIEPAAAAANAVFGGTASNDTWNAWDVDVRQGNMGGYNYIQGVKQDGSGVWDGGGGGYSTLYDGTGTGNPVQIRSLNNSGQHSPAYGLPTSGPGFAQLVGGGHSAGTNGGGSYSVQISGLTAGDNFLFYSYAQNIVANSHGPYKVNLDGAAWTTVTQNEYIEGAASSGELLSGIVPSSGSVVVNYTQAGMTGPAFQFATVVIPQTAYWTGVVNNGVWTSAANFSSDVSGLIPWTGSASTADVVFNATTVQGTVNSILGVNQSIKTLTFSSIATAPVSIGGSHTLTITPGSALTGVTVESLSGNHTISTDLALGAAQTWTVTDATQTLVASGVISGGFGLTQAGAGKLTLSGANTFTGGVLLSDLSGSVLSVATIGNGGVAGGLGQADNAAANLVFAGSALQYTGLSASTDRSFTINADKTATFDITSGSTTLTISGASAASSGSLTKTGPGTLALAGTHAYTGATAITGGTLSIGSGGSGGSISTTSGVGLSNNATIAFNQSSNQSSNAAFSPVISGTGSLVKDGTGALTVSGDNTFVGSTTVSGGTLVMGHANALGNASNPLVLNAGTLNLNGNSLSVSSLSGSAGTIESGVTGPVTVTVNASGNSTFSGGIQDGSGTVGLTKNGSGSLTLAGANAYTGTTAVNAGKLVVNGSVQTGATIASNASLGGSGTVNGALSGAGTISPGGSSGAAGILSAGSFDATGGLDVAFEFTATGDPNFTAAANSVNDVLNLTDVNTDPFAGSFLTADNAVDIYFNVDSILPNTTFNGGIYVNFAAGGSYTEAATLVGGVQNATYNYWSKSSGSGERIFNGVHYDAVSSSAVTLNATDVNLGAGFLTTFTIGTLAVPEPNSVALAGIGIATAAWILRKKRGQVQFPTPSFGRNCTCPRFWGRNEWASQSGGSRESEANSETNKSIIAR